MGWHPSARRITHGDAAGDERARTARCDGIGTRADDAWAPAARSLPLPPWPPLTRPWFAQASSSTLRAHVL